MIATETAAERLNKLAQVLEHNTLFDKPVESDPDFAHPSAEPPDPERNLTRARSRPTDVLRRSPPRLTIWCAAASSVPAAAMAVPLELELAGRVATLPGNRVALLTDEAHWNE